MPTKDQEKIAELRRRAEQALRKADRLQSEPVKRAFQQIAKDYEELAAWYENKPTKKK